MISGLVDRAIGPLHSSISVWQRKGRALCVYSSVLLHVCGARAFIRARTPTRACSSVGVRPATLTLAAVAVVAAAVDGSCSTTARRGTTTTTTRRRASPCGTTTSMATGAATRAVLRGSVRAAVAGALPQSRRSSGRAWALLLPLLLLRRRGDRGMTTKTPWTRTEGTTTTPLGTACGA